MWWSDYFPMPWMHFGPMFMIIFVIICMAVMFFMMRGGMMHHHPPGRALDILGERYARGEIDEVEYKERRKLLQE